MVNVAINGFGRIGRMVLKGGIVDTEINFVAINDLTDTKTLAHLLKYDSVQGRFPGTVEHTDDSLIVNGKTIKVFAEKDPANLPWRDYNVDIVVESTGFFRTRDKCQKHIDAGAKKVLLSAPGKDKENPIKSIVVGVNDWDIKPEDNMISNASCTTNCLAPVVKVLQDKIGIVRGFMTTIHSYTGDQRLIDAPHADLRRARSAALSMIPTSTGAAIAVGKVIPEVAGKLDGTAIRVPTPTGSVVDLIVDVGRETSVEEVNGLMQEASNTYLKNILGYETDPIVSVDVIGDYRSSIFDSFSTKVIDKTLVRVLSWYDNEWGYSCRMVDMIKKMM